MDPDGAAAPRAVAPRPTPGRFLDWNVLSIVLALVGISLLGAGVFFKLFCGGFDISAERIPNPTITP
jgi:hypothetical protein